MGKRNSTHMLYELAALEAGMAGLYALLWQIAIKDAAGSYAHDLFWVYGILVLLSMTGIVFLVLQKYEMFKWKKEKTFCLVLLVAGLLYGIVFPAFSCPDEDMHFTSACRISNLLMGKEGVDENGDVFMRREDTEHIIFTFDRESYHAYYKEYLFAPLEKTEYVGFEDSWAETTVPFTTYLAPAVFITFARILKLGGAFTAIFGRVGSLVLYLVLIYYAFLYLPFGKKTMMVLCQMPMTLFLMFSMSYDNINFALVFLFVSLVLHYGFIKEEVNWKDMLLLLVLAVCFIPIKVVYLPMVLLLVWIPNSKFKSAKEAWAWKILIGVVPIIETLMMRMVKFTFIAADKTNLTGETGYPLSYVLHHPLDTLGFLLYSMFVKGRGDETIQSFAGKSLGWLDTKIPTYMAYIFIFLLLLSVLTEKKTIVFKRQQKMLAGFVFACGVFLPVFVMLLAETALKDDVVACVQGRYFIPIIILAPVFLQNSVIYVNREGQEKREHNLNILLLFLNSMTVVLALYKILGR